MWYEAIVGSVSDLNDSGIKVGESAIVSVECASIVLVVLIT